MSTVADERKIRNGRRAIKKRYPAPACPECNSDDTEVTHSEEKLRRFHCVACKHRWKKERSV